MYALPFSMCPHVPTKDMMAYECSDRILLSTKTAKDHLFGLQGMIYIHTVHDECATGSVYKIIEDTGAGKEKEKEKDCIYMPAWMFWKHDFTGPLRLSHGVKQAWTAFQIRPHRGTFQNNEAFVPRLQSALRAYSTLNQNTRMPLCVEGTIEYIQIDAAFPTTVQTCSLSLCESVNIQIFPAQDVKKLTETPVPVPFLYSSPPGATKHSCAFLGKSFVLGGSRMPSDNPMVEAANATRKRMALK
jgi:hypothetical protein